MARAITKKSKRELLDLKTIKEEKMKSKRKQYTQNPTMRLSAENLAALKKLRDCLEIRHKLDMVELNISGLSVDDGLSYVLIQFSHRHQEIAEVLDINSNMSKILKYSGVE